MSPTPLDTMDTRRFGSLHQILSAAVRSMSEDLSSISPERQLLLGEAAGYIASRRNQERAAKLIFICTHNSRRSHMSQIWAQTAAWLFDLDHVETYSGGTEATAFHRNALHALSVAGFEAEQTVDAENPHHFISYSPEAPRVETWSKTYDDAVNPHADFAAVMTCSDADEACPIVLGADARFPIRYDDPKFFDGTPREAQAYAERCRQIGVEMLWMMAEARKL